MSTSATSRGGSGCFSVATIIKRRRRRKRSPPWEFWEKMIPLPNSGRRSGTRLASDVPVCDFISPYPSAALQPLQKNKNHRLNCILEIHLAQKAAFCSNQIKIQRLFASPVFYFSSFYFKLPVNEVNTSLAGAPFNVREAPEGHALLSAASLFNEAERGKKPWS